MERRLTVALLLHAPQRRMGGVEATLFRLAAALSAQDRVHVLSAGDFLINCPEGVTLHPEPVGPAASWRYAWTVWQWLRRLRPDVVHTHDRLSTATLALIRRYLPPHRWIVSIHPGETPFEVTPAPDALILPGEAWRGPCDTAHHARVIAPPGEPVDPMPAAMREQVRESLGVGPGQALIVALAEREGRPADVVLRAVEGLNAVLRVPGEGPDDPEGRFRRGGHRSSTAIMQAADVMILTAASRDSLSAMTPALLAGCPPIAPDGPDSRDWLPDYLLYEAGSPDNLRAVIQGALALQPNLRRGCLPVFLRAREALAPDGATRRLLELYDDLMETRHEPLDH